MPTLVVNVVDDTVTFEGVTYPVVIDDDMFTFRVISFDSENEAYGEHHGGYAEKVDPVQAAAIFHRFKDIWNEADTKRQEALRAQQEAMERENLEASERRAAFLEEMRKPRMVPPNKPTIMARMLDEELVKLDSMVESDPVFRMLWKHTEAFMEPKDRIIDLMLKHGFGKQRAQELFADIQIDPPAIAAPEGQ